MLQSRRIWRQPSLRPQGTTNDCKLASVKGSLKLHSIWWHEHVNNTYILDIIDEGYKLPLLSIPPVEKLKNNKTARDNVIFVSEEIETLLAAGILIQLNSPPTVINALTVANNAAGKKRWF